MSEEPATRRRFRFDVRRSLYGWAAVTFAFVACALLIGEIATIVSARAQMPPMRLLGIFTSASNGSLTLCSEVGKTVDSMDDWANRVARANEPFDDRRMDIPGLHCRAHVYEGIKTVWVLELSILIPWMAAVLLAAICFYLHRASGRQPILQEPNIRATEASSPRMVP